MQIKNRSELKIQQQEKKPSTNNPCGPGPQIEELLVNLKPSGFINGKPVFSVPTTTVLNLASGFGHKLLCDSLTFTAGSACVYSCSFCYVIALLRRNKWIQAITKGKDLKFSEIVVRREQPVEKLRKALTRRGKPKFLDPADTRVIYASPLVDIAPTMEFVIETAEMCLVILELTNWQIRLLSKSPLITKIAEKIPAEHQHRMIYGLSTGTLNDGIAKAIEIGTPLVSKRIEALHKLQNMGLRTYGMACPILPQLDPKAYAARIAEVLRVHQVEHVWAEALNVRDESMTRTCDALRQSGYHQEAELLKCVSEDSAAWEDYARQTFLALKEVIPANKLRFLQYVQKDHSAWWHDQAHNGAVLLGQTVGSAPDSSLSRTIKV
jgi:DNA repair photolyase